MPSWNVAILLALFHMRTPAGIVWSQAASMFAGPAVVIAVFLAALYVLSRGRYFAHALGLVVALVGALGTAEFLKDLLQFSRPDDILQAIPISGYGFPSAHATSAMALYGFLLWSIVGKRPHWSTPAATFFSSLILLVGFSRLYLGVHWPIDVLGGYLIGFVFIVLGARITRMLEPFEQ